MQKGVKLNCSDPRFAWNLVLGAPACTWRCAGKGESLFALIHGDPLLPDLRRASTGKLGYEHRGAADSTGTEAVQRLVGLAQGKRLHRRSHGNTRRERKELLPIAAGEVGDGAEAALFPQELVGEARDVAHVNAAADDGAAFGDGFEGERDQLARRGEDDRGIRLFGREGVGAPDPGRSQ